jgi:hypothetical protein
MTPSEAINAAMKGRTRLINGTLDELRALLQQAERDILALLAALPSDYQAWYLPQLQAEIRRALEGLASEAAAAVDAGQVTAWRQGSAMVDSVLAASAVSVVIPQIDPRQLSAMRRFLTEKIKDVSLEAANLINSQLGLVVIGAQNPFDAVKSVSKILGETTLRRGTTIVSTELNRAFSAANQLRMEQSAQYVPGLQKKWLRSGKREPRPEHVAIHGQVQPVDKPFLLEGGAVKMMQPGDPSAPARHTINCGCASVPVVPKDNPYGIRRTIVDEIADNDAAENARARELVRNAARQG